MAFNFKFSNLIGVAYNEGNIAFHQNGTTVVSPVGNRLSLFNLKNNEGRTLPIEARYNIKKIAVSHNSQFIIIAVEDGNIQIIHLYKARVIYSKKFNKPPTAMSFSPDGKYFAIAKDNSVLIYFTPPVDKKVFNGFILKKVIKNTVISDINCIDWTNDGRVILFGSNDMSSHVCGVENFVNLYDVVVGGSSDRIVATYFLDNSLDVLTVNKQGHISIFESNIDIEDLQLQENIPVKKESSGDSDDEVALPDDENDDENENFESKTKRRKVEKNKSIYYKRLLRLFLNDHIQDGEKFTAFVTCACYHKKKELICVGFSNAQFMIACVSDNGKVLRTMKILENDIDAAPLSTMSINPDGNWLAMGIEKTGKLVVYEWESETFLLKQQSHFNSINVADYSPDGTQLATGGTDGKIKLWDLMSTFCTSTIRDHKDKITALCFAQRGRALISASVDGTVRAFSLPTCRKFRTMTTPTPAQLSCMAIDSSAQFIVAGAENVFDIFLWSLQTGNLLQILGGHSGPVISVQFSSLPGSTTMVSTAWDKSAKIWDAIENTTAKETLILASDGSCVAISPDGSQLAVATIDGQICFFDVQDAVQFGSVQGKLHLTAGRSDEDMITASSKNKTLYFTTICFTPDGKNIIGGGNSKTICIYNVEMQTLMKMCEITQNRSFDAMDEFVNKRKMTKNGTNLDLIRSRKDIYDEKLESKQEIKLPGVKSSDRSLRAFKPEVCVTHIIACKTGRQWATCTTEGLLLYSLDSEWLFDPFEINEDMTIYTVHKYIRQKDYSNALMVALKLNILKLIEEVIESVPPDSIDLIVPSIDTIYCENLLGSLAKLIEKEKHYGIYIHWVAAVLSKNGIKLKQRSRMLTTTLNSLERSVSIQKNQLSKVLSYSVYKSQYIGDIFEKKLKISAVENSKNIIVEEE